MFTFSLSGLEIKTPDGGPQEVEENEITARSAVYMVLGSFFAAPDRAHYDKALNGTWDKEIKEAASLLPYELDLGSAGFEEKTSLERYVGEYDRLFGEPGGVVSLRSASKAEHLDSAFAEIKRDYEYFGLGVSDDASRPLDHLVSECDFLQYLCFKEAATASPRLAGSFRRAQRDFLERHLVDWVPEIAAVVTALSPAQPFAWGIGLLDAFINADHAYVVALLGA